MQPQPLQREAGAPQVVCATLTGVLSHNLQGNNGVFDVAYVDESAQVPY